MAFKVLFHFCMIFCVIQLSSSSDSEVTKELNNVRSGISRSKDIIRTIMADVGRTKQSTNSVTSIVLQGNMKKLYDIEKTTGAKIEKNVLEMKKPGKNVAVLQKCIQSAKMSLRAMCVLGINRLHSCSSTAKNKAKGLLDNLDVSIATGNHLMNQLHTIESRCSIGNIFKRRSCMEGHLKIVNSSVGAYETSSMTKKNEVKNKFEDIISWQNNCSKDYLLKAQETSTKVIADANKCIQAA